jgi:hypothetical protein
MAPKPDTSEDERDFLDEIGLTTEGEHATVGDDDAEGAPWSPVAEEDG